MENVKKTEIYEGIFDYECPEGYHFESFGQSYGRHIYGRAVLDNPYIIVKDKDEEDK